MRQRGIALITDNWHSLVESFEVDLLQFLIYLMPINSINKYLFVVPIFARNYLLFRD